MTGYEFAVMGPYENNGRFSIVRKNPTGGDDLTIVTIARIHRDDDLYDLVKLANEAFELKDSTS